MTLKKYSLGGRFFSVILDGRATYPRWPRSTDFSHWVHRSPGLILVSTGTFECWRSCLQICPSENPYSFSQLRGYASTLRDNHYWLSSPYSASPSNRIGPFNDWNLPRKSQASKWAIGTSLHSIAVQTYYIKFRVIKLSQHLISYSLANTLQKLQKVLHCDSGNLVKLRTGKKK